MNFHQTIEKAKKEGAIPERIYLIFLDFYSCYESAIINSGLTMEPCEHLLVTLLNLTIEQIKEPHHFQSFHQHVTSPFNYYRFGLDLFRPIVDLEKSKIFHPENLEKMEEEIKRKENVVLLANHQTESDPQLISLALEKGHEEFAKEIIFVAGDRVITDPMAAPMSMGRNLLCIYSKRHIENPPEMKREKLLHNQRVLQVLKELLSEGGKTVYVAPSGGRDRPNEQGVVEPAPFDPNSIELFRLIASQTEKKTHFYPFSLSTYDILPPPHNVEHEIGEKRVTKRSPIFFSFCDEFDFSPFDSMEKKERREAIAKAIHAVVKENYWEMKKENNNQ